MKKEVTKYLSAIGKKGRARNTPAQQEASRKNGAKKKKGVTLHIMGFEFLVKQSDGTYKKKELNPPPRRHTRAEVKYGQGVAKARKGDV